MSVSDQMKTTMYDLLKPEERKHIQELANMREFRDTEAWKRIEQLSKEHMAACMGAIISYAQDGNRARVMQYAQTMAAWDSILTTGDVAEHEYRNVIAQYRSVVEQRLGRDQGNGHPSQRVDTSLELG